MQQGGVRAVVIYKIQQQASPGGAGKLFGLHSGDGHQLWSLGFAAGAAPERVLPWRTSHDTSQVPHRAEQQCFVPMCTGHI